jgi:hypothetical protein
MQAPSDFDGVTEIHRFYRKGPKPGIASGMALGIHRRLLYRKVAQYGIERATVFIADKKTSGVHPRPQPPALQVVDSSAVHGWHATWEEKTTTKFATSNLSKENDMQSLEGSFKYLIYAPKGEIEGVLLHRGGEPLQLVIDKHDVEGAEAFHGVAAGQTVKVRATESTPSPKGKPSHPVYDFKALESVDGMKPTKRKPKLGAAYQGTVVRLNYAKHGEANGVVLDSGDFIHTRPDGMKLLRLQVGDAVEADGDAQRLADDTGWAVDATTVNGKTT